MIRRVVSIALLALTGCGSSAPAPERGSSTPAPASPTSQPAPEREPAPASPASKAAPEQGSSAPAPGSAGGEADAPGGMAAEIDGWNREAAVEAFCRKVSEENARGWPPGTRLAQDGSGKARALVLRPVHVGTRRCDVAAFQRALVEALVQQGILAVEVEPDAASPETASGYDGQRVVARIEDSEEGTTITIQLVGERPLATTRSRFVY